MKITVETTVQAPIDTVWAAYTTPSDSTPWNAASDDWRTTWASVDMRVVFDAEIHPTVSLYQPGATP